MRGSQGEGYIFEFGSRGKPEAVGNCEALERQTQEGSVQKCRNSRCRAKGRRLRR